MNAGDQSQSRIARARGRAHRSCPNRPVMSGDARVGDVLGPTGPVPPTQFMATKRISGPSSGVVVEWLGHGLPNLGGRRLLTAPSPAGSAHTPVARATIGDVFRALTAIVVLTLALTACSSSEPSDESKAEPTMNRAEPTMSEAEVIQRAEAAAKDVLPDAPIWEGVTFAGSVIDDSTVCVDRTWPPDGGIDGKGGSAGYVLVTFPGEALGEPQDGVCSDVSGVPETEAAPPVEVPEDVKDEPGLTTRTDMGDEWPLTLDYGVVACENDTAGGQPLMIATFADPGGTLYALNGTAKSHTDAADIEPIWADDPEVEGLKISIGPLIDHALTFC